MMKKITILIFVYFISLNCQNKKENHISKETEDINNVVEAVIECDSINDLKQTKFCSELKKLSIVIPPKRKDSLVPPVLSGRIDINELLNDKIDGEIFFSSKDSAAIMAQNSNPERLKVLEKITDKLDTTSFQEEMTKRNKGQGYNFYEMSIPLFSLNKQKAYLTLEHFCGGLCGSGMVIYLKKINGVWKVIGTRRTWIS